jgi:Cu(I)/Ag(I) efflux system membrane protein CusA/SilA
MISAMVFTGVFIAFAGGFIMIGLYDTDWFLNFDFFGTHMRDLFQIRTINLSVAVWVGFLALFGIATDDGVLVATFLKDSFKRNKPTSIPAIRDAVVEGGLRRVRPAMMTTATTILALIPILTSTGRGSDIMLPMAIPSFGGMTLQVITMFTVPVIYALWKEWSMRFNQKNKFNLMKTSALIFVFIACGFSIKAQPLTELKELVITNNLQLKVLEREYLAALQKVPQVGELPDPEVGVGAFPLPVETRLGPQIIRISATQMFPWFGTLDSRRDLELAKAKAKYERIAARLLNINFQLEMAYFNLYEVEKSQMIISRNLEILAALEELALAKVESGKSTAADVLRVQLKTEELKQELTILETAKTKPTVLINQLLNRSLDIQIQAIDTLRFANLIMDKNSLFELIEENHPTLHMFELQQEISRQALSLNALNGKPSFGVGLDYMMVGERMDADPSGNGRDIVQLRGTVKVPLYRNKYAAKEREEQIKIEALESQKADHLSRFISSIEIAYADYKSAQLKEALYQKQKRITEAAIEILESEYSAKGKGFDELLRLEKDLIDYDLKILKAVVQSHRAKSSIQRYLIDM